jgi:hypothetical protein
MDSAEKTIEASMGYQNPPQNSLEMMTEVGLQA